MRNRMFGLGLCLALVGGCEADVDDVVDAPLVPVVDGSGFDGGEVVDAAVDDASIDAAEPIDAGEPSDGPSGCHGYGYGAPAVDFRQVASVPAATGGAIPAGIYDAVDAQTTSTLSGSFRSTWVFTAETIDTYEQITLQSTPPPPTPRTFQYTTSGTRIVRTVTCGGTTNFNNEYSVRTVGSDVFFDLKQNTILFTFKKR